MLNITLTLTLTNAKHNQIITKSSLLLIKPEVGQVKYIAQCWVRERAYNRDMRAALMQRQKSLFLEPSAG